MGYEKRAFYLGLATPTFLFGGLATALVFQDVAAREALTVELLSDTYEDCLPEQLANPHLTETSYSPYGQLTVNAPVEGGDPYVYELENDGDGSFVVVPGDGRTWRALAAAGCDFPRVD